jgi:hypothetical protein
LQDAPPAPFSQSFVGVYATTSYAANGLIPWNTGVLPRSFVDGLSSTIMFAERPQVCRPASGPLVYNLWGFGAYGPETPAFALLTPDDLPGLPSTGQVAPALPLPGSSMRDSVLVRVGRASSNPIAPLSGAPFQTNLQRGIPCDPRLPGTSFVGGMLVAMADGSVRTLSPTMSQLTFWSACTPAGREPVYPDW